MSGVRRWASGIVWATGIVAGTPQAVAQHQGTARGSDAPLVAGGGGDVFANSFLVRRARPVLEASAGRYFDLRLMPDFGRQTTLAGAYQEGKLAPALTVRAGKFKPPVRLERLLSATDIAFAERGLPTNLAPDRDLGLQAAGELSDGVLSYQVGVFDGVPDLGNGDADLSDAKDVAAHVLVQPFRRGALKRRRVRPLRQHRQRAGTPAAPASTTITEGRRGRLSPHVYLAFGSRRAARPPATASPRISWSPASSTRSEDDR